MLREFAKRINLNTDLDNISKEICNEYNLGQYISDTIIEIGYEDFNYILETSSGKYCVKIFNIKSCAGLSAHFIMQLIVQ